MGQRVQRDFTIVGACETATAKRCCHSFSLVLGVLLLAGLGVRPAEAAPKKRSVRGAATAKKTPPRPAPAPVPPPVTEPVPVEPTREPVPPAEEPQVDAQAAPEVIEEAPVDDPLFRFSFNGFVENRSTVHDIDDGAMLNGVIALRESPRSLVIANAQAKVRSRGDVIGLSSDISLAVGTYESTHLALFNELSIDGRQGPVRLLIGRRRLVWGSGLAVNPTDVLNPLKDPLNPDMQRTGALLLPEMDVTLGPFIISALFSPRLTTNDWGLPKKITFDDGIVGGRVFATVAGLDLNLMYFRDFGKKRHHGGLSASRFFGDHLELHLEAMIRNGKPDAPEFQEIPGCGEGITAPNRPVTVAALAGARAHFDDRSVLIIEYLYDGNGIEPRNYDLLKERARCMADFFAAASIAPLSIGQPSVGLPPEPAFLVRPHHVFFNYSRPHLTDGLFEDIMVSAGATVSPADFSAILQTELGYNFSGRAMVSARLMYWAGKSDSEIGSWPARWVGIGIIKVSF